MMKKGRRASKLKWKVFGYLGVKINSSEISNGRGRCQKFLLLQNPEKTPNFTKNLTFLNCTLIFDVQARGGIKKIIFGKTRLEDLRKKNLWSKPQNSSIDALQKHTTRFFGFFSILAQITAKIDFFQKFSIYIFQPRFGLTC